ncbi:MAG: EamA family transporter [Melioribacteraceae bacterium]|nr:EamA family transporter [Melioribacteraceae bacterium]
MHNIFLTIFCSTSIALILKHNDTKRGDALLLLAGNYFTASLISLFLFFSEEHSSVSSGSIVSGVILGFLFLFSFFAFSKAVNIAGTALATVSSRVSVIIPFLLSVIIFSEKPDLIQLTGFSLALLTIYFFYLSLKKIKTGNVKPMEYIYLIAVLVGVGVSDFGMKVFEQNLPLDNKSFFLFVIFGTAFTAAIILHVIRKRGFERRTFLLGNLLGIPNLFSSYFLISALFQIPAVIVYPVTNIGIIILTSLSAFLIWNEKMNRAGIVALITGGISIALLSI